MGYGNGKSYLDDWDEWDKRQRANDFGDDPKPYAGEMVAFKGKNHKKGSVGVHYLACEPCYAKHPPLRLPNSELVIYGGSCSNPIVKDADVYVGFDEGSMRRTERSYPWKRGTEFVFSIRDMSAPENADEFKKLVAWTLSQLKEGKKVHCGCIGGHGRTGTFLAALCAEAGEKDAIGYVRKTYCKKAVEATSQVNFLAAHFGVMKVEGYKSASIYSSKSGSANVKSPKTSGGAERFTHVPGNGCIWDLPGLAEK